MPENEKTMVQETVTPEIETPVIEESAATPTADGDVILSAVGRTPAKNVVPVICLYSKNSGWNRGAEIYHAKDAGSAKDLLASLAQAEANDWAALGLTPALTTAPDGLSAEVCDPAGKTEPSRFLIGVTMASVSLPEKGIPDTLKNLMTGHAAAAAPETEEAKNESPFDMDDSLDNAIIAKLMENPILAMGLTGIPTITAMSPDSAEMKATLQAYMADLDADKKASLQKALGIGEN